MATDPIPMDQLLKNLGRSTLGRKTRIKVTRKKARPNRLKGEDLTQLRKDCWDLDLGKCRECGIPTVFDGPKGKPDTFEMAHIRGKRMWGDDVDQVRTLCAACHRKEHAYGKSLTKPVPAKTRKSEVSA